MPDAIRVVIADDHPVVRQGLRALISAASDMEVVGEAADGGEAVAVTRDMKPSVTLLDMVMPVKDGLAAITDIKADNPDARILVLTSFAEDDKVLPAIKAGALGYLLKDSAPQDLLNAIREVERGESSLHPTVARKLVQEISQPSELPPSDDPLTEREADVLKLVARGLSNQEIAESLGVGLTTVGKHVSNILTKLHLANRTQAALYALQEKMVDLEQGRGTHRG